jgi:hypothetical protein
MLRQSFFPKWHAVLHAWLSAAPNFDEVTRWYLGWKGLFPEEVLSHERVRRGFNAALDMMNQARACTCTHTFLLHAVTVPWVWRQLSAVGHAADASHSQAVAGQLGPPPAPPAAGAAPSAAPPQQQPAPAPLPFEEERGCVSTATFSPCAHALLAQH